MHEKDFESIFHEITSKIEFEEPSMDIAEFNRCMIHLSEVRLLLDRVMEEALADPDVLLRAGEDFAILMRDLAGVSDELAGMLIACSCPKCNGCDCEDGEICEICDESDE